MLDTLLKELELLRKGIKLASDREKVPTYVMELNAVLKTADVCISLTNRIKEKVNDCLTQK